MAELRDLAYGASGVLARPWMSLSTGWRPSLRVVAYHGVQDVELFRIQMAFLANHLEPVTATEVIEGSFTTGRSPVWVTFDDGDQSLMELAMQVLDEYGISATAFICPGLVDTSEPFWWEVVQEAIARNVVPPDEISRLKQLHDSERRGRTAQIGASLEALDGKPLVREQLTTVDLRRWVDAGHSLGNHTWDHPLLDMCEPEEQRHQIVAAHEWLVDHFSPEDLLFAYPNGNHSPASEAILRELGYAVGALFDHRVHRGADPLQMSRIRVNAADGFSEFKAKVSGIHPMIHSVLGRS